MTDLEILAYALLGLFLLIVAITAELKWKESKNKKLRQQVLFKDQLNKAKKTYNQCKNHRK